MRGIELASAELLEAARRKGRTIVIAKEGSEELRFLRYFGANANAGGERLTHIILLEDPRKIEVLEEFLHGTQMRIGIVDREGVLYAEIHVKRFMLRHRRLLGISEADAQVVRAMLGGR